MIRRLVGVLWRPRTTLAGLVERPVWVATWGGILIIWALLAGWLLGTDIGQQALVDERVRVIEAFGGAVTDAAVPVPADAATVVGVRHERRALPAESP